MKYTTAEEAVKHIQSGNHVFIQTAATAPHALVKALSARYRELKNVSIYSLHTEGDAPYASEECSESFCVRALFV